MTSIDNTSAEFLGEDFLLDTPAARELYHGHAEEMPIIDYHCHLSPREIADNKLFGTITRLWLGGDHYKWRAMRANGIDEKYITGDADDREKFRKWAETVPYTMRNPLYIWTHAELRTAFGIDKILSPDTADEIYDACNERLQQPDMTPRGLMEHYRVECVCTTDDPIDSLEYHRAIAADNCPTKVLPAWRADKAHNLSDLAAWRKYIATLSEVAGIEINGVRTLIAALQRRHDFFAANGCRVADIGVSELCFEKCSQAEAESAFSAIMSGKEVGEGERVKLASYILLALCRMNAVSGWAQQIHFGPMRNVNSLMYRKLGPDSGFDTIGDYRAAVPMARLLDTLNSEGMLAPTVLYNLNPADNVWTAAMAANFQDSSRPGKMQFGSAWWFNDHIDGMRTQIDALSCQGLLSRFVGMLTDSRSFLSYPRHDLFRRVLCSVLGSDVDRGLLPRSEMPRIGRMVEDISYRNAKNYFRF